MNNRRISFVELAVPLRLDPPAGPPIAVTARDLTYVSEMGLVSECRITVELAPADYRRVDRDHLFHLGPEARGAGADRFAPAGAVLVEARLAPALVADLLDRVPEPAAGREGLGRLAADGGTALLSTESWYALSVSSPVELPDDLAAEGTLATGYATTWASAGPRLAIPMLTVIAEVLDNLDWSYEELDDDTGLGWEVTGHHGSWWCYALAREAEERFAVYSVLDAVVPADRRVEGAELVARANYALPVGNWELEMDEGTLRYKTSIEVGGDRLSVALASRAIQANLAVVDAYLAAFEAFAEGRASAREAIALAEG